MMWKRQNPAYLIAHTIKLLSAWAALSGPVIGLYLLYTADRSLSAVVVIAAAAALIIIAAITAWSRNRWRLGRSLALRRGVLTTITCILRRHSFTAAEIKRSPFLSLFGSVRISLYTHADSRKNASCSALTVKRDTARQLAGRLMPIDKGYTREYRARRGELFLLALSQSDFLSGLLLSIPLLSWATRHIDRNLSARIYTAFESAGQLILPDVSPLYSAFALIPAAGWLTHTVYSLFAFGRFRYVRSGGSIMTGRGIIVRKTLTFPVDAVTAIESRRTLLTGMLHRESCRAIIPGAGSCLLLPPTDRRSSVIETAAIFPHGEASMRIDTADCTRWWRWWGTAGAALLIISVRIALTAGRWRELLLLLLIPAVSVLFWRTLVGADAGKKAGIRLFSDSVEITGVRGLSTYRLRVLRGCIAEIKLTQNIFQQSAGLCSVYIRPHGALHGLRCCHMPMSRCMSLIGRLG